MEDNDYQDMAAIIGMAGRFPGASDIDEFWDNLCKGVESISFFTQQESLDNGADPDIVLSPNYVGARGILKDAEMFDAQFFGFSPREAELTDPQHRLFLECSWTAFENAGYCPKKYDGSIAVYAGAGLSAYLLQNIANDPDFIKRHGLPAILGNDRSFISTRVSYKLDLKGPSISVNTACSTSLAAVHLAYKALNDFQCDMAIAGGVSLYIPQKEGYIYEKDGILSPDGHCRAFDAESKGTVGGSAVAVVVLKRLEEAIEDNDYIYAVIKGSGMNNDGSLKVGFTAPSDQGQAQAIHEAQKLAEINPETITFIEAHGTGTALGDPVEIEALNHVFQAETDKKKFCAIGSVKANIGHLDTAAGVAGLIKAAMAVKFGKIPPSINFKKPNPRINFENSPFFVNTSLIKWQPKNRVPRRAGVSSFGIGGTNVHVVLEQGPQKKRAEKQKGPYLLVLSAKTKSALNTASTNLAKHLKNHPEIDMAAAAYTLQEGRQHFDHRRFVICKDASQAAEMLISKDPNCTGFVDTKPGFNSKTLTIQDLACAADSIKQRLMLLGRQWLKGDQINWSDLYPRQKPGRVPLPSYPFEPRLYMLKKAEQTKAKKNIEDIPPKDITQWFHIPSWKRTITLPYKKMEKKSCWLIFADQKGLGLMIAKKLKSQRQKIVIVKAGSKFEKLSETEYTLCPGRPDNYDLLIKSLFKSDIGPDKIVHLWTISKEPDTNSDTAKQGIFNSKYISKSLDRGFYSLLFLVQALSNQGILKKLQINIVTTDLHHLPGDRIKAPQNATVLGPLRVIPQEYPNISCRNIDIRLSELQKSNIENRVNLLISEFKTEQPDTIIAYRDSERWVQTFERVRLDPNTGITRVKENGVYIITGGLGSMGMALAGYLAEKARVKIVLTGRAGLPPRNQWDKIVSLNPEKVGPEFDFIDMIEADIERELSIKTIDMRSGLESDLNRLCSGLICDYFSESGILIEKGKAYNIKDIFAKLEIEPRFKKFLNFFINTLKQDAVISVKNGHLKFIKDLKHIEPPNTLIKRINKNHPGFKGIIEILTHCAGSYKEALSGKIEAIGVLYPQGSSQLLKQSEKNTVEHVNRRVYINLLKKILVSIAKRVKNKKLKILEIGAGNGAITWNIAQDLLGFEIEYHFTDIGKLFVIKAEKEASKRGINFMKFGLFDISKDPEKQGYEKSSFDVIMGLDVAHVTESAAQTISNLKKLLNPQGIMLLIETVKKRRWIDMVWGLAEAWWYFKDTELRKDSPLLEIDQWDQVFKKQGFKSVRIYPIAKEKREKTDFALITAVGQQGESDYNDYISKINQDKISRLKNKIINIKKIEALGSEVLFITADVAGKRQMQNAVSQTIEKFGTIDGVIHTAGIFGQGIIQLKTVQQTREVLKPKITGTLVLSEVLSNIKLDFFILCSSMSSVAPIAGQIDYSAANAFLDAFAFYNTYQNRIFTVSIDWGFWQELGMIEDSSIPYKLKKSLEQQIIKQGLSNAGVKAFDLVLSCCTLPQIIVSPDKVEKSAQAMSSLFLRNIKKEGPSDQIHQRPDVKTLYKAPVKKSETVIADIWKEVLGIDKIGIYDDFFDLGGDSLLGIQIVSRVNSGMKTSISISTVIKNPTISKLAAHIDKTIEQTDPKILKTTNIPRIPPKQHYPLSHAQKGLWLISQTKKGSVAYNITFCLWIKSEVEKSLLKEAFAAIVQRHESLRTTFIVSDGRPGQKIHDRLIGLDILFADLTGDPDSEKKAYEIVKKDSIQPFDLEKGPLFRIRLITLNKERHLLLFAIHHIVSDGWSLNVILKELIKNYKSLINKGSPAKFPDLGIQYRDYAAWQEQSLKNGKSEIHRKYWQEKLSGCLPVLDLPIDFPRPLVRTYAGAMVSAELSLKSAKKLKSFVKKHQVSMFITLLTGVKVLLYRYTGQEEIIVGSPATCRGLIELENQVGLYLNTLPLRDNIKGTMSFQALLNQIRQTVTQAFDHQQYPFDMIVRDLNIKQDQGRPPIFDVMVNLMLKEELFTIKTGPLKISLFPGEPSHSLFALDFLFIESKDTIKLGIRYSQALFKRETVLKITQDYIKLLDKVLDDEAMLQKPLLSLFTDSLALKEKADFIEATMNITEDF